MSLKAELAKRIQSVVANDPPGGSGAEPSDAKSKLLNRIYGQRDIWYLRAGNKFRLFVVVPGDNGGEIRTVTMVLGRLGGVNWKDDMNGGWITVKGGDPVQTLEGQLEKHVGEDLRLHELTRI